MSRGPARGAGQLAADGCQVLAILRSAKLGFVFVLSGPPKASKNRPSLTDHELSGQHCRETCNLKPLHPSENPHSTRSCEPSWSPRLPDKLWDVHPWRRRAMRGRTSRSTANDPVRLPHAQVAVWSVGYPADSRPGVIVARSNLASALLGAPRPVSCCSGSVDHDALHACSDSSPHPGRLPCVTAGRPDASWVSNQTQEGIGDGEEIRWGTR